MLELEVTLIALALLAGIPILVLTLGPFGVALSAVAVLAAAAYGVLRFGHRLPQWLKEFRIFRRSR